VTNYEKLYILRDEVCKPRNCISYVSRLQAKWLSRQNGGSTEIELRLSGIVERNIHFEGKLCFMSQMRNVIVRKISLSKGKVSGGKVEL
jgi:hypothetical protein